MIGQIALSLFNHLSDVNFIIQRKMKNLKFTLQLLALLFIFLLQANILEAQWNTNTSVNIQISSLTVADMQCAPTTDGKTWIAFYVQNGGNYDMHAQLIDANGYKLLGTDGVLVSNEPSGSATYVFSVCVDASNNLIIAFQDQRSGPVSAVAFKISEAGTQLWGATGIVLGGGLSPYPAVLSTGETVIAWNETASNSLNIQKITTSGTLAWASPVVVTVGSTTTTRGQLIGNTAGKFTMVYQKRGTGISTTLYAQQYDNSGTALYSALQICNQTTSGARYYSIAAEGDTTYFGYYSSIGFRFNSFLQRINPGGSLPWGVNGSNFNTSTGSNDNYQGETRINITPGASDVWSVCTFSDPNQTIYGVYIQKFVKTTGARLFTDAAKVVYPISSSMDQQTGNLALVNDTPMFMSYDVNYKEYATRLDASGNFVWPGNRVEISSTTASAGTPKMRECFTPDGPNRCAGTWTENRGSSYLGYAQGISVGGLIGIVVGTQGAVPPLITTPGGTLQMVSTVYPSSASQAVTWSIVTGTGLASISAGGLVTAIANGTVWAKAIATQDVTVKDSLMITISNQAPLPPAVVTNAATSIGNTTATLNGTVTANNSTTTVSFNWGTTVSYGNTIAATPGTVTGNSATNVSANLTGLIINTTYHFRCTGTSSAGTTNGNDMTFTTGCQPIGPAGTITGPTSVCINSTGNVYTTSAITYATGYSWTVPTGATITAGQNTTSITVTFGSTSGNVAVFGTNTCSNGTPSTLPVSVNPPPVPTISGSNTVCQNAGLTSYTTETGMTNYVWTVTSGGTISTGAGTNQIQVTWTGLGAQTVTVNYTGLSGCAATSPTSYAVTVNPIPGPAGGITGTPVLCAGSTGIAYSVDSVAHASTYIWYLPSGATIASGLNTRSITVDFSLSAVSGDINVLGNNICGDGQESPPFPVTVNPVPPTPVVTYSNYTLTSSAVTGNQWYFSPTAAGTPTPIPGAINQTYYPTQIGYYTVIVTLNSCTSSVSNQIYVSVVGFTELNAGSFNIYPIPGNGKFTVTLTSSVQDIFIIRVHNLVGEKIFDSGNITVSGSSKQNVDLRPIPNGIYTMEIINGNSRAVKKLVVSN
jgi:hypothetical protein